MTNKELRWMYKQVLILSDCPTQADYVKSVKREVREFNKQEPDRHIIKEYDISGYIELVELPDFIKDESEAKWWFMNYHYISDTLVKGCGRDCTGYAFTSWYKIIQRRGQFYAYHWVAFDV